MVSVEDIVHGLDITFEGGVIPVSLVQVQILLIKVCLTNIIPTMIVFQPLNLPFQPFGIRPFIPIPAVKRNKARFVMDQPIPGTVSFLSDDSEIDFEFCLIPFGEMNPVRG